MDVYSKYIPVLFFQDEDFETPLEKFLEFLNALDTNQSDEGTFLPEYIGSYLFRKGLVEKTVYRDHYRALESFEEYFDGVMEYTMDR